MASKTAGFERAAYEVQNGAKLSLSVGTLDPGPGLTGTGTDDLRADVNVQGGATLDLSPARRTGPRASPGC